MSGVHAPRATLGQNMVKYSAAEQLAQGIAAGSTVTEIASKLALSPKTVSTHKARLLEKMHMSNQAELIRYAIEQRLVAGDQG